MSWFLDIDDKVLSKSNMGHFYTWLINLPPMFSHVLSTFLWPSNWYEQFWKPSTKDGRTTNRSKLLNNCVKAIIKLKFAPCTVMWERNKLLVLHVSKSSPENSSCIVSPFHQIHPLCVVCSGHFSIAPGMPSSEIGHPKCSEHEMTTVSLS